ncbi:MAG: hypothetical protein ACT4QC_08840 [Planctomycetaceae bacterium]
MPRFFLGNFEFEYELAAAGGVRQQVPKAVRAMSAALASAWIGFADPGDYVLATRPFSEEDFPDLTRIGVALPQFVTRLDEVPASCDVELVPWGWSAGALAAAKGAGWVVSAPPLEVVRRVNSREFRWQLEQELGVAPSGSGTARSVSELRALVARCGDWSRGWILKANFGMSGRESLRGSGDSLSESAARWAARRLERTGAVVVEPRLDLVAEAGVQVEVPQGGPPQLVGVAEQIVDSGGAYRGSRFGATKDRRSTACVVARPERGTNEGRGKGHETAVGTTSHEAIRDARHALPASRHQGVPPTAGNSLWQPAVEVALRVALRLQALGYFGPLGIDAAMYRDVAGQVRIRPLQDLNARFTLGRLALGFGRFLPAGWCGSWLWLAAERVEQVRKRLAAEGLDGECVAVLWTSPEPAEAGEPRSILLAAQGEELRAQAERCILGRSD